MKQQYQSKHEAALLKAGAQAQTLIDQLAITAAASQAIIKAMRELRAGVPLPEASRQRLNSKVKNHSES